MCVGVCEYKCVCLCVCVCVCVTSVCELACPCVTPHGVTIHEADVCEYWDA